MRAQEGEDEDEEEVEKVGVGGKEIGEVGADCGDDTTFTGCLDNAEEEQVDDDDLCGLSLSLGVSVAEDDAGCWTDLDRCMVFSPRCSGTLAES